MRELARHFELVSLCFYRKAAQETRGTVEGGLTAIREFGSAEAFPIPQEHSGVRLLMDHGLSVGTRRPYTWYAYRSDEYRSRLRYWLERTRPRIVHMDSLDLVAYASTIGPGRTACVHHNVESKLLRRRATAAGGVRGWYFKHQAGLIERLERQYMPRFLLNVAVSADDRRDLLALAPDSEVIVAPNGVDVETFRPGGDGDGTVTFIGGTEWFPNVEALRYFGEQVLPRIRAKGLDPEVRWVGRSSPEEQSEYRERYGIRLTGYVEEVQPWVQDTSCVIVPLRTGGGTRLKITTAWAMGRAIVSTPVGCEGLAAHDGENIIVRDDPDAFANAVARILRDDELRSRLGRAGRRTAVDLYSWNKAVAPLIERYRETLDPGEN
jgi:glycosyltransferase involved in cell wall biosynthesis